jgi:hypothetical protein
MLAGTTAMSEDKLEGESYQEYILRELERPGTPARTLIRDLPERSLCPQCGDLIILAGVAHACQQ